jgi:nucleoside-triphosphatase THEP1
MLVFLTGPVQVGKSTALGRYLQRRGGTLGGFRTLWDREAGVLNLTLLSTGEVFPVARQEAAGVRALPEGFDRAGQRLLELGAAGASLLLMDELGFLEREAAIFRQAVVALWDQGVPVLGVLRDRPDNAFLPALARRTDTAILPVTVENREEIPARLEELLGRGNG